MINYTAAGDSITYGESASCPAKAYPQLIIRMAHKRSIQMRGRVIAQPGWTSAALNRALMQSTPLLKSSTVISVWIGGDDLIRGALSALESAQTGAIAYSLQQYRNCLNALIRYIRKCSSARVLLYTQYNPFPGSPAAVRGVAALNRIIYAAASSHHAATIPTFEWFEGNQSRLIHGYRTGKIEDALSGSLPIHPNDQGHFVIAKGSLPYIL